MGTDLLADITSTVLAKALDAASVRHRAVANNIANVETPGYKRIFVSFEEELRRALGENSGHHQLRKRLSELTPIQRIDWYTPSRPDGNNVCIDAEIADLIRNAMKQKAVTVLLEGKISMLRSAILEGRR